MPVHIITEPREDYVRRQKKVYVLTIKFFWYLFLAYAISQIIKQTTNNVELEMWSLIGFLGLFVWADFVSKGRIKSYVKLFLGGIYLLLGLGAFAMLINAHLIQPELAEGYPLLTTGIVAGIFLYAGYRNFDKYSNVMRVIKNKIGF